MPVRGLEAGDGPAARRLWDDLGGWYRNTSPSADGDVDRAIGRLLRTAGRRQRHRRGQPAEGGWVAVRGGEVVAWLYARADPEQNYLVPLVPPEESAAVLPPLLSAAKDWFFDQSARRVCVDVPSSRPDLRAVFEPRGRSLWHRIVLDRDLTPLPEESIAPVEIREFRRSDLPASETLFGRRHPETLPPPIPVAFLELRGSWVRDPAWELQRGVWVAGPRRTLIAVAGGTLRPGSRLGFLGPWVLDEAVTAPVARTLLSAVVGWLKASGAERIRTTVPSPASGDALSLLDAGFAPMAESDLFEVKL